ncbi:hypothetical protein E2C01_080977 [Portunus trituberculatus]|uniref:Uncharacterized protein n=1 Tax=Portunus trituberculatus TaxID=210409 RepID=A0A5B7IL11_PORTR|nr:hypothetical protein [Portunus trituberculatus]
MDQIKDKYTPSVHEEGVAVVVVVVLVVSAAHKGSGVSQGDAQPTAGLRLPRALTPYPGLLVKLPLLARCPRAREHEGSQKKNKN